MRRRPVLLFFLLALLLSWAGWIPYAASRAGRLDLAVPAELIWLSEYGPTVAALLVTGWLDGAAGIRSLLGRVVRWRVPFGWYPVVIFLTPAIAGLVWTAARLVGREPPDVIALGSWQAQIVARTAAFEPSMGLISGLVGFMRGGPVQAALVFALLAITNGGVSEELGWRGFAQPRLQSRWSALAASVMVGVLWGLWHTGTGFWQVMLTSDVAKAATFAGGYLLQYLALVVPLAVIYAWVVNSTESLLLAILLHASYNMTITVVATAWPGFPVAWLVVVLWIVAAGITVRFGSAKLAAEEAP